MEEDHDSNEPTSSAEDVQNNEDNTNDDNNEILEAQNPESSHQPAHDVVQIDDDDDEDEDIVDEKPNQHADGSGAVYFDESTNGVEEIIIDDDDDDDDDILIEGEVRYTEEMKIEARIAKIDKLLSWFVKLRPEYVVDCKVNRADYLTHMITEELAIDIDTSRGYLDEYQTTNDVECIMSKYNLESDQLVVMGICIATLDESNERNINFDPLCDDRVDSWTYANTLHFLENHDAGVEPNSKHGPSELMVNLAAPPAYVALILTIIWLEDNKCPLRCNWTEDTEDPEDKKDKMIRCTESELGELEEMIVDYGLQYWRDNLEIFEESAKFSEETNEIFKQLNQARTVINDEMESIQQMRAEISQLAMERTRNEIANHEPMDEFELMTEEERNTCEKQIEELKELRERLEIAKKEVQDIRASAKTLHEALVLWPGEICLARTDPIDQLEMQLAVVEGQINNVTYTVRFVQSGVTEDVNIRDIGYARFGMMDGLVMQTSYVGLRVVCLIPNRVEVRGRPGVFENRHSWLSGTIAGRWMSHGDQFLVFLDNGDDVYVEAPFSPTSETVDEIYKIPTDTKDASLMKKRLELTKMVPLVAQAFNEKAFLDKSRVHDLLRDRTRAKFIKTFMHKYPEWPLVRAGIGNMFHIYDKSNQRQKSLVVVVNIDRVFCVVRHVENINHPGYGCTVFPCNEDHKHTDEKIYRGSSRIRDIMLDKDDLRHLSRRSRMKLYRKFDIAEQERTMPVMGDFEETGGQKRNETKKRNTNKNGQKTAKLSTVEILERKRKQNSMIKTIVHTPVLKPLKDLKYHSTCGPDCLKGMDSDPYDSKFHTCSPLHVPLICGWRRYKYTLKTFKKRGTKRNTIMYYAPCGKPLPSMKAIGGYLKETSSMITIDCFSFDIDVDTETYITFDPKHVKMKDYTEGIEGIPIPAVNSVDNEEPPKIEYTKRRFQYDSTVDISTINRDFCSGCTCEGDCSDATKCECQQLSLESYNRLPDKMKFFNKKTYPRYENRLVSEKVTSGIYECNDQCSCHRKTCFNRVVQNNIKYPMAVFKTAESGWGVRALTDIPAGAFLCNYVGALLTNELADALQNEDQYFADLDMKDVVELEKMRIDTEGDLGFEDDFSSGSDAEKKDDEEEEEEDSGAGGAQSDEGNSMCSEDSNLRRSLRRNEKKKEAEKKKKKKEKRQKKTENLFQWESYFLDKALFVVDAKQRGNLGRFLNHSCDPNVTVQHILYDTHDLRLPWVSFFARRAVKAGDELCWDYSYSIDPEAEEHIECKCGADNCRGILL